MYLVSPRGSDATAACNAPAPLPIAQRRRLDPRGSPAPLVDALEPAEIDARLTPKYGFKVDSATILYKVVGRSRERPRVFTHFSARSHRVSM